MIRQGLCWDLGRSVGLALTPTSRVALSWCLEGPLLDFPNCEKMTVSPQEWKNHRDTEGHLASASLQDFSKLKKKGRCPMQLCEVEDSCGLGPSLPGSQPCPHTSPPPGSASPENGCRRSYFPKLTEKGKRATSKIQDCLTDSGW